jgi:hypothetical protein
MDALSKKISEEYFWTFVWKIPSPVSEKSDFCRKNPPLVSETSSLNINIPTGKFRHRMVADLRHALQGAEFFDNPSNSVVFTKGDLRIM